LQTRLPAAIEASSKVYVQAFARKTVTPAYSFCLKFPIHGIFDLRLIQENCILAYIIICNVAVLKANLCIPIDNSIRAAVSPRYIRVSNQSYISYTRPLKFFCFQKVTVYLQTKFRRLLPILKN